MPFVTVQIGQCGNQLGAAWFETVASELSTGAYSPLSIDTVFEQRHETSSGWAARAVLVDMEPKVIYSAQQSALASNHGWRYTPDCSASGQSGSGNNWALGHNKFGPALAPTVLDLVRKQVEACDVFEGFLMLQSMAGGTGAGAGTYLTHALVDEYSNAHMLNCCVWPYESGEVTVQPYNTLLSMSSLAEVSSGILLLQNEVLNATCSRLLGIQQPGFKDLNAVAARGLTSALLPSQVRPATPPPTSTTPTPITSSSSSPAAVSRCPASNSKRAPGSSSSTADQCPSQPPTQTSLPLSPLTDLTCHLFNHPSYRVASVRTLPQVPATSLDFTTFSWKPLLARLKAMGLSGAYLDEHLSSYMTNDSTARLPLHKYKNKVNSALVLLRGKGAASVPVWEFADAAWFPQWAVDPLLVAHHPARFGGCQMSATLLATDKACVSPLRAMQDKAYSMLAAKAYVHEYEAYGMQAADFQQCFAVVEDVLAAYAAL